MSQKINFQVLAVVFLGAILFSGCGGKGTSEEVEKLNKTQKTIVSSEKEKLPAPTGNVSDIINAVNSEAEGEDKLALQEANDAEAAALDKIEADNFGSIYDENEF